MFCVLLGRLAVGVRCNGRSGPPGSLAGLVDVLVDVLGGGQLWDAGLRLLVGHLSCRRREVLIALKKTHSVPRLTWESKLHNFCIKRLFCKLKNKQK